MGVEDEYDRLYGKAIDETVEGTGIEIPDVSLGWTIASDIIAFMIGGIVGSSFAVKRLLPGMMSKVESKLKEAEKS